MADVETLLPPNRQPAEEALEQAVARAAGVSVPLSSLAQPYTVSTAFLPWMAWGLSADLWRAEWPEERKRVATATSLTWHAKKGTRAAIRHGVRLAGFAVRRFTTPPSKTFLAPELTPEERERFLSMFTQLRVYPFFPQDTGRRATKFLGAAGGSPSHCFAGPLAVTPPTYRRAILWDRGEETELTVRELRVRNAGGGIATQYDEVRLPAKKTRSIHLGVVRGGGSYLVDDQGVRTRLIKISRDADYAFRLGQEQLVTYWPKGDLIDVRPRTVAERHPAQFGAHYCGCGITASATLSQIFVPPSRAAEFLYEQWHLHDPDKVPEQRTRATHLGYTRLGMPPYTAEVRVEITHRRSRWTTGRFVWGHPVKQPRDDIRDTRRAIVTSKALRDKILLNTRNWRPPRPGDRAAMGDLKLGQLIEV